MTTEHPDLELARRAITGDPTAWQEIYTATRQRLFGLLTYQTGSRDEALDILQDTYLAAVRSIRKYRGTGSLESWLVGIALNRARDWKRRILPRMKQTGSIEGMTEDSRPTYPEAHEERRTLQKALNRLPARQRAAVLLYEWFGYTFQETAQLLGISESTARVHCFRGREALRTLLTEAETADLPELFQEQRS